MKTRREFLVQTAVGLSAVTLPSVLRAGDAGAVANPTVAPAGNAPSGVEVDGGAKGKAVGDTGPAPRHRVSINAPHLRVTQVMLQGQTDRSNKLVAVQEWLLQTSEKSIALAGNIFAAENLATGEGKLFVRCSPQPNERPEPPTTDLQVTYRAGEGADFALFIAAYEASGGIDPWKIVDYTGGVPGRTQALHHLQQALRPATPGHVLPRFLTNTWGDRNRDSRIQHDFILAEIKSAAALGADVVQIDDGWQKGISANSADVKNGTSTDLAGFWRGGGDFWTPHPKRFPQGLAPIVAAARASDVLLGLWFAPDSTDDFANWEKDAAVLVSLFKEHGIEHFKVDGVHVRTPVGLARLHQFFDRVAQASSGRIVIDLDVTAGRRPGYLGLIPAGPLFVENRYTDWHNYWPHHTLRNVWQLASWIDPRRLRMEFLNNERHADLYRNDPIAPVRYGADYLFATVMVTNPLGWFELSSLSAKFNAQAKPIVQAWRQHREKLFAGTILPIGDAPDGYAWTGFLSISRDRREGYLLVFRELNPEPSAKLRLPMKLVGRGSAEVLAGEGTVKVEGDEVLASVPGQPGFVFARFAMSA